MVNKLQVRFVQKKDCYISLPMSVGSLTDQNYSDQAICRSVRLTRFNKERLYVGFAAGISKQENELEISHTFAQCLGLEEGEPIDVEILGVTNTEVKLELYVTNIDYYEMVCQMQEKFESNLLNQISVIYPGLKFPAYYSDNQYVLFEYKGSGEDNSCKMISPQAELVILPPVEDPSKLKQSKQQKKRNGKSINQEDQDNNDAELENIDSEEDIDDIEYLRLRTNQIYGENDHRLYISKRVFTKYKLAENKLYRISMEKIIKESDYSDFKTFLNKQQRAQKVKSPEDKQNNSNSNQSKSKKSEQSMVLIGYREDIEDDNLILFNEFMQKSLNINSKSIGKSINSTYLLAFLMNFINFYYQTIQNIPFQQENLRFILKQPLTIQVRYSKKQPKQLIRMINVSIYLLRVIIIKDENVNIRIFEFFLFKILQMSVLFAVLNGLNQQIQDEQQVLYLSLIKIKYLLIYLQIVTIDLKYELDNIKDNRLLSLHDFMSASNKIKLVFRQIHSSNGKDDLPIDHSIIIAQIISRFQRAQQDIYYTNQIFVIKGNYYILKILEIMQDSKETLKMILFENNSSSLQSSLNKSSLNLDSSQHGQIIISDNARASQIISENPQHAQSITNNLIFVSQQDFYQDFHDKDIIAINKLVKSKLAVDTFQEVKLGIYEVLYSTELVKLKEFLSQKQIQLEDKCENTINQSVLCIQGKSQNGKTYTCEYIKQKYPDYYIEYLDFAELQESVLLDYAKNYISTKIQIACIKQPSIFICDNIERMCKSLDRIDFQQFQLILVSEIISKYIKDQIKKYSSPNPRVKFIFLTESKDIINSNLLSTYLLII